MSKRLNSRFITSDKYPEIKEVLDKFKHKKSKKELYEMIIQIDPNLPSYQAFIKFMQEYNTAVQEYRQDFLKDVVSEAYSAADMLNIGISKAFELGNIVMGETLEEIKMKLQEGESIPRKDKQ